MDAGQADGCGLEQRVWSFHTHEIGVFVLPAEYQSVRVLLVLDYEVFDRRNASQATKV